ncbi:MAG: NAD(P)-dependent oxidoreductase [Acidimicrobiales bacterium]
MSPDAPTVGFVGLGQMGAPMATRLAGWPGGLVVCDVRPEATAALAHEGAEVATTPAAIAERADVISVMVLDDGQVTDVVCGPEGILVAGRSGLVVAIHSTIRPSTAERLAERCAPHGVAIVDAPVSGGFMGAHEGRLAVLVGGDDDAVERCRAPFGRWADLFVHLGPVGAGTRGKLARNLLHFVAFTAAAEAQRLAEASGISLNRLARVVRHSDAVTGGPGAIMLRPTTEPLAPGDDWYDTMLHVRALGEKDLTLALDVADELAVDVPLARIALERFAAGLGVPHEHDGNDDRDRRDDAKDDL